MTIHFNAAGAERKKLAMRIAEYEGCETQYLGAPTFAYAAGRCKVLKDGTVETENEDSALLTFLEGLGGVPEPTETPTETDSTDTEDTVRISICLPAHDMTERQIQNVFDLVESKQTLIKKAVGANELPITLEDGKLCFDWFDTKSTPEERQAYMALLCGIRGLAMTLHRVNRRETEVPNEKYAFRCFLLRLGMVGNDSKAQRKILLKNLSGSSAWRDVQKDGADDE